MSSVKMTPVEVQLVAENAGHDAARERRRPFRVERGHEHMGGDDRCDLGRDGGFERAELDRAEPIRRVLDDAAARDVNRPTCRRDPGKCFPQAAMPASCSSVMITRPSSDTRVHRVGERTIADRRVFRVRQHIQHRRIVERHTHRRELLGKGPSKAPRQVGAAGATQRNHGRPFGERPLQPRDTAALLIDRHPGRELSAERLDLPGHFPDLIGILDVPLEQDHAANGELARERLELDRESRRPSKPATSSWPICWRSASGDM